MIARARAYLAAASGAKRATLLTVLFAVGPVSACLVALAWEAISRLTRLRWFA